MNDAEHKLLAVSVFRPLLDVALAVQTLAANDNQLSGDMPPFLHDGLEVYDLR